MKSLLSSLAFTIVFLTHSFSQESTVLSSIKLKKIDSLAIQDVPKGAPGIATGIVKNGKVIYQKTAGFANLKDSVLINPQSRFNIASNGKQFTALAVLVLIEDGKLSLKDEIRKFFPNLYPNLKTKITIENLLNHSSGIRDVYDLWSLKGITWWKQTYGNQDALDLIHQQKELNFIPGSKHSYSNSNYILLAEIIGKASGKSFVDYTSDLFKKLGMPNTSFTSNYKNITGAIASPYFNFNTWTNYNWTCNINGDGNLFSTLEDQLVWETIIQTKKSSYLSSDLIDKSQKLIENSFIKNYGYGLELHDYKGYTYQFHEGATGAWKATVTRFPTESFSIVTLTNSGKTIPSMQTRQIADVLLNVENKKETYLIKPENIGKFISGDEILGVYQTENDFTFQFEKKGDDLFLIRSGRNDTKLVREAANIFHQWNDEAFKQEFNRNVNGEMEVTAYYTSHAPYTLKRKNVDWASFNFSILNGIYKNNETEVSIKIKHKEEKNYSVKIGNQERKGLLIAPNKLLVNDYVLEVDLANQTLFLNGGRIQKVRFCLIK